MKNLVKSSRLPRRGVSIAQRSSDEVSMDDAAARVAWNGELDRLEKELGLGPIDRLPILDVGAQDTCAMIVKRYAEGTPEFVRWRRAFREHILSGIELHALVHSAGRPCRDVLQAVDRVRGEIGTGD
jgi:hypothetical protein